MKDIFFSYRRLDSSDVTGRIFDQMKARFREDRLFKDVDSIPLGKDFRPVISKAVGQCKVLLAVIGKDWLTMTSDDGRRRIDDPNDYVHIEIATALNRRIPVIPVLVEHTMMPQPADLPEPLRNLAFHNGTPVRSDPDFHHDIDRLCSQLVAYVPQGRMRRPSLVQERPYVKFGMRAFGGVAVCVVLLIVGMIEIDRPTNEGSPQQAAEYQNPERENYPSNGEGGNAGFFEYGKADLTPGVRTNLEEVLNALRENPSFYVHVVGHTSFAETDAFDRSKGADLKLAQRRAEVAANFLRQNGVPTERITTDWQGENKPAASSDTPEGRAENRRLEISVDPIKR